MATDAGNSPAGGPFGDGFIPPDSATSSVTFWDAGSSAFETDYFNSDGNFVAAHWDDYSFQNGPTSDAGFFLNFDLVQAHSSAAQFRTCPDPASIYMSTRVMARPV